VDTYWLDATEVTLADYAACVAAGACTVPGVDPACDWGVSGRDRHPVNCVDWPQAAAYCAWAGKRLPEASEWEWAARGRDEGRTFPWGEAAPSCAWAVMDDGAAGGPGCGAAGTVPVGSKPAGASRDGVLDLAGNVWEWTSGAFDPTGELVQGRGGGWSYSLVRYFQASDAIAFDRIYWSINGGFRCAQTP